jgi:tetratricopeptide (TPR) repeat protein
MTTHFERGLRLFQRRWLAAALWEWGAHLPTARRNPADLARTFNAMATALMDQDEMHQAFIKAELARDVASQLPSDHPQTFYAHLNGALAAFECGDLEAARARAAGALASSGSAELPDERRVQAMVVLAWIAIEGEQYEVADAWLRRARELPPPTNRWRVLRALTLNTAILRGLLGDADGAEQAFAEALALSEPGYQTNVRIERGWMRLRHGDLDGAVAEAREVVDGLLAVPAFLKLPNAADGLLLLSALARAHGDSSLSSRLYMQGFAWLATAGWRAHLRRSTRAVADVQPAPAASLDLPKWMDLVRITEALTAGEHRGPGAPQRLGQTAHRVAEQFGPQVGQDTLGAAAVFLRLPQQVRTVAALPTRVLLRRLERGRRDYDAGVLAVLDTYDRALVEEGQPYPAVLERMTREAGTSWEPRAVQRLVLAHAS